MKCTNCGHELEPGSGFCENCGMIISLDNDETSPESVHTPQKNEDDSFDYIENGSSYDNMPEKEMLEQETVSYDSLDDAEEELQPIYEDITSGIPVNNDNDTEYLAESEADGSVFENEDSDEQLTSDEQEIEEAPAEEISDNAEEEDDGLEEMLISKSKSKKGGIAIAVLIVVLVAVVAGGVSIIKGNFSTPVAASTKATSEQTTDVKNAQEPTTSDEITDEATEEETQEETTAEKETTEKKETTEDSQTTTVKAAVTTSDSNTTAATTQAATASGTTATTTQAATTVGTTKATTNSQTTTTAAVTNSSTTTDKYGISDAKVKTPSSYLKNSYTGYVTAEGVHMRSGPSTSSEHVLYLSKGADVKVLASQSGFFYVYSNRYGVYGWVSSSYVSQTRPQTDAETTVPNLVSPDKTYSSPETKYVNADVGLRLRKGPGSSYDVIELIPNGYPVKVKGYSTSVSGWVYVTDTTYGVSGWVSSAYLK